MYNHYIPQSDGSYRRSSVPEANRRQPQKPAPAPPAQPQHPPQKEERPPEPQPPVCTEQKQDGGLLSILRRFLPKQIDSADLLVIVLLLLLSDQDGDDDLAPLLTIALYFML